MRPRGGRRPEQDRVREPQTRINEAIRVREVQLIGDTGENKGIVPIAEAQRFAEEKQLDLVEISPQAKPPVCRVMDYGKWKYEQNIKAKEARKNRNQIITKEIKFRPKIGKADYETKKNHVRRFLEVDDKVKVTIMFRGREVVHHDLGRNILNRVAADVADIGTVESHPNLEGRNMTMMLGPVKKQATSPKPAAAPATDTPAEAPQAQASKTETPKTDAPKTDAPKAAAPKADDQDTQAAS